MGFHGVWTRKELIASGMSASTLDDRCRAGMYTRVLPGVYCVGRVTSLARCAAVVAWIPGAVLSHRTAGWLWEMLPEPAVFEATVPRGVHRVVPEWVTLYRRDLPGRDVHEAWGVAVTSAARTLMDCLVVLPESAADELVDSHLGKTVERDAVLELCGGGGVGAPGLRRQVWMAATNALSEPERLFARAVAQRRVRLLANHSVGPYVCDFVHRRSRTIVEIDGREFHSGAAAFRRDRQRQNWLVLQGWLVLRYAAADVYLQLERSADEVVAVIRDRGRRR